MQRSLKDKLKVTKCLDPDTVTATGAGAGVNNAGFGSLMFLVAVGATSGNDFSGTHKLAITMQDSDVDVDGSYANCVDADIHDAEDGANGIVKNLDATDDADSVHVAHYRGNKKFARIKLVETGTVSVPVSVVAVQGHSELMPPL